jgi:hypothetical protein
VETFFGDIGLSLLSLMTTLLPAVGALYIGLKLADRGVRTWVCWAIGLTALVAGWLIFMPAKTVLDSELCRHADDYELCIEGGEDSQDWP